MRRSGPHGVNPGATCHPRAQRPVPLVLDQKPDACFAVAALALAPMAVLASASSAPSAVTAAIDCPSGYVCIHPEINFGGQPWVRRAVDGSVKDLPSAIRDRGSSIRNTPTAPPAYMKSATTAAGTCAPPAAAAPSTTCAATTSTTRPAP
ncbi:peptidase inhibitor family I36 protein [Streptomyces coeruleorubidus]|uniref:peptidase inhibitor family I36 protein n=1 Tax=Streptomyces coeruleorubidus TaxID=116188 RepID=UPI00367EB31F